MIVGCIFCILQFTPRAFINSNLAYQHIYVFACTLSMFVYIQSDLYYPQYLGVLNFGLKNVDKLGPRIIEVRIIEIWLYFI